MILFLFTIGVAGLTYAQLWCLRAGDRAQASRRMLLATAGVTILLRLIVAVVVRDLPSDMSIITSIFAFLGAFLGIMTAAFFRRFPKFASGERILALVIINVVLLNCVAAAGALILYGAAVSKAYGG